MTMARVDSASRHVGEAAAVGIWLLLLMLVMVGNIVTA
jgi:hypothetical protein